MGLWEGLESPSGQDIEGLGVLSKKIGCVNLKNCVQSIDQVGKNWVCICKFGCVKHYLHGWLAASHCTFVTYG